MKMSSLAAALTCLALVFAAPAHAAACSSFSAYGSRISGIQTGGVGCSKARSLIRGWVRNGGPYGNNPSYRGWLFVYGTSHFPTKWVVSSPNGARSFVFRARFKAGAE